MNVSRKVWRSLLLISLVPLVAPLFGIALAHDEVTHFSGDVSRGQVYKREIGSGLLFVLSPTDTGWMIRIVPQTSCADSDDWARVVNSPYRNYNSLFVDASYGITARQAVKDMNPREFSFVLTCADYKSEGHRLDVVLWPYTYSKKEADAALANLGSSPLGKAIFTILNSKTSRAEQDIEGKNYGKIDWLTFRLDVTFPAQRSQKRR